MTDKELAAKRDELIAGLQEDLSREYKAIIQYVIYSQVLDGAEYMPIAEELEVHAHEELDHARLVVEVRERFALGERRLGQRLAQPLHRRPRPHLGRSTYPPRATPSLSVPSSTGTPWRVRMKPTGPLPLPREMIVRHA